MLHHQPAGRGAVAGAVEGLSPGEYRLTIDRMGYDSNDSYSLYLEMGSPTDSWCETLAELKDLSSGKPVAETTVNLRTTKTFPPRCHCAGMTVVSLPLRLNNNDLKISPSVHR
jgi:hypothetical protein